jgi:predicted Zn finger-like uncharacterized protein
MILTCPSCSTRYQADSARFVPPGRNVRCAKCSHIWFQPAPLHELEPEPEPEPVIVPPEAGPPAVTEQSPFSGITAAGPTAEAGDQEKFPAEDGDDRPLVVRLAQVAGWVVLLLMVASIGWASVQYRETIAGVWPPSASVYAFLGMPVNVRGIALVDVAYHQVVEDGQQILSVTGKVVNISDHELPVPIIRVALSDQAKRELYHWTFDVGVQTLKPGGESPFVTRLSSPPPDARNVDIRFAAAGDTQ